MTESYNPVPEEISSEERTAILRAKMSRLGWSVIGRGRVPDLERPVESNELHRCIAENVLDIFAQRRYGAPLSYHRSVHDTLKLHVKQPVFTPSLSPPFSVPDHVNTVRELLTVAGTQGCENIVAYAYTRLVPKSMPALLHDHNTGATVENNEDTGLHILGLARNGRGEMVVRGLLPLSPTALAWLTLRDTNQRYEQAATPVEHSPTAEDRIFDLVTADLRLQDAA